jgi:hypothetical protein
MKYCSIIKNEIMSLAGKWIELDHVKQIKPQYKRQILHVFSYNGI